MSNGRERNRRRSYRPTVEALEALRLLNGAVQSLPDLVVERDLRSDLTPPLPERPGGDHAWDEALSEAHLADILGRGALTTNLTVNPSPTSAISVNTPADTQAGLDQLNKYLSRAWYRAGVPVQKHEDCSQAVYVSMLQNLGRTRFDQMAGDIGRYGIREVLSRETEEGPDFFRAIDTVKKRAQRERSYQPLDTIDVSSTSTGEDARALWRGALQDAIDQSLTPREASLVYETLMGKTPAEIASIWGVAPKTVSNEKTRVIQKLREALVAELVD